VKDKPPKDKKAGHPACSDGKIEAPVKNDGGKKPGKEACRNRVDDPAMNGDPREHGEDDELDHQKTDKPDGKEFHCRVVGPLMKHDKKRDYRGDEGE